MHRSMLCMETPLRQKFDNDYLGDAIIEITGSVHLELSLAHCRLWDMLVSQQLN